MKITFPALLFLVLLVLKATHTVDWSWWIIWAPFWVPLSVAAVCFVLYGLALLFESEEARKQRKVVEALQRYSNALRKRS